MQAESDHPRAAKRSKHSPSKGSFLEGIKVYVPTTGLPHLAIRARTWAAGAARAGGSVVQDLKEPQGITLVVVVGGGIASLPPPLRPPEAIHPPITPVASAANAQPHEQAGAPENSRGSREQTPTSAGPKGTSAGKRQTSAPGKPPKRKCTSQGAGRQLRLLYVSHTWLEQCLAQHLPEAEFPPPDASEPSELQTPANAGRPPSRTSGSLGGSCLRGEVLQRQRWLGPELWHPRCAEMPANELVLQAVYSEPRSRALGNEAVVQALKELAHYERGLNDDVFREAHSGREVVNYQALRYSRAAAAVRAINQLQSPRW